MSDIIDAVRPFGVAIDYDDTFTSCPETWGKIVAVLRAAGARVVCVTYRTTDYPVNDFPGEVFYTSGTPKAEYMHAQQVDINVWIDDQPHLIGMNPEHRAMREGFALPC